MQIPKKIQSVPSEKTHCIINHQSAFKGQLNLNDEAYLSDS